MSDWIVDVIDALGYVGLAALMLLECVFPPIPSEVILPFAGFAVAQGTLSFPLVILASTAGSLAGNVLLYVAARHGGQRLVGRHGGRLGATPERMAKLEGWFVRWGAVTVLVCRAIPLVRSAVSLPAGLARYPLPAFLVLTTIGSAIWNTALVGAGWALEDSWRTVEERFGGAGYVVFAVLVVASVAWAIRSRRRRRSRGVTPVP